MNILFLCVANSARSQIAEGLAKALAGGKHHIQSAGSEPSGHVHPLAIEVMQEIGIDISSHHSKAIDDLEHTFINNLDYAITLCAEEVCPVLHSGAKRIHLANPDPAATTGSHERQLAAFRQVRNAIKADLEKLLLAS